MEPIRLPNGSSITLKRGDITAEKADAIVNAANAHLLPGGGVSGAIHAAAGPLLELECRRLMQEHGSLDTGDAILTGGYELPAAHVIHTIGPVWAGGESGEAAALARAYRSCISVADEAGLRSIAFPSLSTGIFGYPLTDAAPVALAAVVEGATSARTVRDLRFVLYDAASYAAYEIASRAFAR